MGRSGQALTLTSKGCTRKVPEFLETPLKSLANIVRQWLDKILKDPCQRREQITNTGVQHTMHIEQPMTSNWVPEREYLAQASVIESVIAVVPFLEVRLCAIQLQSCGRFDELLSQLRSEGRDFGLKIQS